MKILLANGLLIGSMLLLSDLASGAERRMPSTRKKAPKIPVDHRIPVNAVNTPGDAQYIFIISQSGSFYFTNTIHGVSEKFGIQIAANNVTLDLNGFSLVGVPGAVNGISIDNTRSNIVVRNGFVSNWGTHRGVLNTAGITSFGANVSLERLVVSDNRPYGIYCFGAIVRDCNVSGSSYGIFGGSVVTGCQVKNNGAAGIFVHTGASITTNVLSGNTSYGIFIDGANSFIEGNFVTGINETGFGIFARDAAYVTNNVVSKNVVTTGGARNYSIDANVNDVGPIGPASTNSSPWGNISD